MAISVPDQWSVHASSPFRQPPDQCRDRDRFAVRVGRPRRGRHDGHAVPPGVLAAARPVDNLQAVAVASPSDAWAVGTYEASGWAHTLIEHWNGTAWTVTVGPNPGGPAANNYLHGVAATSASSAWAVGSYRKAGAWHTLIEHWDGTRWRQVASPGKAAVTPGTHLPTTALSAVTALSPSDIW